MDLDLQHLHHAYLVVGNPEVIRVRLLEVLGGFGIQTKGSPDFHHFGSATFTIDEARMLILRAQEKSFAPRLPSGQAGKKIFIISSESLTREAQNALLKTLEEPYPGTHFFIIVRDEQALLPTLVSRMRLVRVEDSIAGPGKEAENFLSLSMPERLNIAKNLSEQEVNLLAFLDDLLLAMKLANVDMKKVREVYEMRRFAQDRSVSRRLILEHLAVVL